MLKQHVAVKQVGDRLIRSHRSQVTPQQYAAYSAAFPDYVVGTYADRLYAYANADLTIVRVQPVGSGYAVFSSVTQPGQSGPFEAIWAVMQNGTQVQLKNLTGDRLTIAPPYEPNIPR